MSLCCKYHAGMLRNKLVIQTITKTADGSGGWTETWTDTMTLPAFVEPVTGGEYFQGMRLEGHITHVALARWRPGITTAMRAKLGDRPLQIRAVLNLEERGLWMRLMLEEGVRT